MDANKVGATISGIILAMLITFFVMAINAGSKIFYTKNIDKYYQQYIITKETTDEKELLDILNKLEIDFNIKSDKISTKYFDYSRGEKVELQSNDLTELLDIYITRNIDKENFELYTKKNALFINKLEKEVIPNDENTESIQENNNEVIKTKTGICLKNDKLYYCKSYDVNVSICVIIMFFCIIFTLVMLAVFIYNIYWCW